MKIWVDADACPVVLKDILCRAADRTQIQITGDLVITGDIPLAAEAIEKGGFALNHRGELYDVNNIRECLNMRDFMDTLRSSGIETGGPAALNQSDRQAFANRLDKFLKNSSPES